MQHEYYFVVQITMYNYVWQVYTYQTKTMFSIYRSLFSARYPTLQATTYSIIYPPPNYHLISYYIYISSFLWINANATHGEEELIARLLSI